jgi:hypothetical protein
MTEVLTRCLSWPLISRRRLSGDGHPVPACAVFSYPLNDRVTLLRRGSAEGRVLGTPTAQA